MFPLQTPDRLDAEDGFSFAALAYRWPRFFSSLMLMEPFSWKRSELALLAVVLSA
jgi:hypothetical protein